MGISFFPTLEFIVDAIIVQENFLLRLTTTGKEHSTTDEC